MSAARQATARSFAPPASTSWQRIWPPRMGIGLFGAHVGQGEQRLGIARTEGLQALELLDQSGGRRRARRDQRVDLQRVGSTAASTRSPARRAHRKSRNSGTRVAAHGQARGHGVAAAGQQQPRVEGRLHRAAEVDARLRAARALADAGGADRGR